MKRFLAVAVLLLLLLVAAYLLVTAPVAAQVSGSGEPGLDLLASTPDGIELEYSLAGYALDQEVYDGRAYDLLRVDGAGLSIEPGEPELPVRGIMVGIPAGAEVALEILDIEVEMLPGTYRIPPVPVLALEEGKEPFDLQERAVEGMVRQEASAIYGADSFYPAQAVELAESGYIRSQAVALVRLNLAQYNPVSGQVRLVTRVRFRLLPTYPGAARPASWTSEAEPGGFEELLARGLANYGTARSWRMPRSAAGAGRDIPLQPPPSANAFKIIVDQDGIYQVTYDDLEQVTVIPDVTVLVKAEPVLDDLLVASS